MGGEIVKALGDDCLGFDVGLQFGELQRRLCYRDSEVVNPYSVELAQRYLARRSSRLVEAIAGLIPCKLRDDLVLQVLQGNIGPGEEITGSTGWVEERRVGQPGVKRCQLVTAL